MRPTTPDSTDHLLPLVLVLFAGAVIWYAHAAAWDLSGASPLLTYDSGQYALAARELAWHGRFAMPFATPWDLTRHAAPPWPVAGLEPGLVLVEALVLKLVPAHGATGGADPRAWLTLLLPFTSFLMLGASGVLGMRHVLARHMPDAPRWIKAGAPATLGLALLLDPEAQHFAITGLPELPASVLYLGALLGLARGAGTDYPFVFGLLLGVAGLFRAPLGWLVPLFALASAWCAPAGRRTRVTALVLLGAALPLVPWWVHQWRVFGGAWHARSLLLWDRVEGRDAFELMHRAEPAGLPGGAHALAPLLAKGRDNLGKVLLPLLRGPRGLWLGALAAWLLTRPRRPLAAAGAVALCALALDLGVAALTAPLPRHVFPSRLLAEGAGLAALWALLQRMPGSGERARAAACVAAAVLALAWGTWETRAAHEEARLSARVRGIPDSRTLTAMSIALNQVLSPGETVMSNLGPALAWHTNHPVVHLAWSPLDVAACRRRHDFRHVVLAFRDSAIGWEHWQEIFERPGASQAVTELAVTRERRFLTADGFTVVWLELGALPPQFAGLTPGRPGPGPRPLPRRRNG